MKLGKVPSDIFGTLYRTKGYNPVRKNRGDTKVTPAFCNPEIEQISRNDTIFKQIYAEFSRSITANVRTFEKG